MRVFCLSTLLALAGGCGWLPERGPALPEPATSPVNIVSAGLLGSAAGPELGLSLDNVSPRTLWVRVQFAAPGGDGGCLAVKELEPGARGRFFCSQDSLRPGLDYPIRISVFGDLEQSLWLDVINTDLRFSPADLQAADAATGG